ncbi:MAG: hypothetical protein RLZZ603_1548 [Actinomycetota bacterium]|jgi:hypothetical protein
MTSIKLSNLPIPQSGCGNTRLTSDGVNLSIEFEYRIRENNLIGVIHFEGVAAYRFANENNIVKFEPLAYESLAEVTPPRWNNEKELASGIRHFALLLSSNGYFEVLAKNFAIGHERTGLLP